MLPTEPAAEVSPLVLESEHTGVVSGQVRFDYRSRVTISTLTFSADAKTLTFKSVDTDDEAVQFVRHDPLPFCYRGLLVESPLRDFEESGSVILRTPTVARNAYDHLLVFGGEFVAV